MPLYYAIALLLIFYVLLVGEFFLPTGGLMGVGAVLAASAAVVIAFTHSTTAGVSMLMVIAATTPVVFMAAVRLWPHTPIGRRILNRRPGELDGGPQSKLADGTPLSELIGCKGHAITDLLPSGQVSIGSRKVNAVSTGMAIDRGTAIEVVKVTAGKVQVRPAAQEAPENTSGNQSGNKVDSDQDGSETQPPQSPASLESPLESLDVDSLE
tara:strand:- start:212330 stop:212962 length:633 start_codon:yes stop_codon:yes gene_type:complete